MSSYGDALPWGGRERWQPGDQAFFEYRCLESHESADAEAWYHSHQEVTVVSENEDDGQRTKFANQQERAEEGMPVTYLIRFGDGITWCAFEDELLVSPEFYERPDPESRRH